MREGREINVREWSRRKIRSKVSGVARQINMGGHKMACKAR